MGNLDILTTQEDGYTLEYRLNGIMITVTKRTEDGNTVSTVVRPEYRGEKLRKLCGMLWAAKATPFTAKELAEDIEV